MTAPQTITDRMTDMANLDWKSRLGAGRETAQETMDTLSSNAREAAATARARIGSTYGQARERVGDLTAEGRELAQTGIAYGTKAAARTRSIAEKALVESRGLIAERPLAAIAVGLAAGAVLGFLANRLATQRRPDAEEDDDIDYYGD